MNEGLATFVSPATQAPRLRLNLIGVKRKIILIASPTILMDALIKIGWKL